MKRSLCTALIAVATVWLGACAPAGNTNTSNANTNASNTNASNANAKPVAAAAPTREALLEMDKKANEAFMKGDSAHFDGMLSDKFVSYEAGGRMGKADMVKMVGGMKCDVRSWGLSEEQMHQVDADNYVLIYKSTIDATCDGQKVPSPSRAVSLWTRSGDKWVGSFHAETLIADPKDPPKMMPNQPPPPPDAAKPAADPNLEALMAVEKAAWEAWKARDAKKLEELSMKNVGFIGPYGGYTGNQADAIKLWTGGQCDIKSVNLTDGSATTLSPTVAILNFKGAAEGTCDGQKLQTLWGTGIYVKEGGNWKLAVGIERPV